MNTQKLSSVSHEEVCRSFVEEKSVVKYSTRPFFTLLLCAFVSLVKYIKRCNKALQFKPFANFDLISASKTARKL